MSQFPALEAFAAKGSVVDIRTASSQLIAEVQTILKQQGLYTKEVDGIAGEQTVYAFAAFKQRAFLNQPTLIGASTIQELLDFAGQPHPVPVQDEIDDDPTGIEFRLPSGEKTWTGASIIKGGHFTWGELTKNGERLPTDRMVEGNLVRLAKELEEVRTLLGDRSITVTSGYRPPKINRQVGGSSASRHITGEAADIIVQGIAPLEVYARLDGRHSGGLGKSKVFTHIDVRGYKARWKYN